MFFLIALTKATLQGDLLTKTSTHHLQASITYYISGMGLRDKGKPLLIISVFYLRKSCRVFGKREIIANALLFNMLNQKFTFSYKSFLNKTSIKITFMQ